MYLFQCIIWLTNRFTFHSIGKILKVAAAASSEQGEGERLWPLLRRLRLLRIFSHLLQLQRRLLRLRTRSKERNSTIVGWKSVFMPKLRQCRIVPVATDQTTPPETKEGEMSKLLKSAMLAAGLAACAAVPSASAGGGYYGVGYGGGCGGKADREPPHPPFFLRCTTRH